jgi:hypothetical protein
MQQLGQHLIEGSAAAAMWMPNKERHAYALRSIAAQEFSSSAV